MSKVARYYSAEHNPEERFFPGVPLRDLTEDEFNALPEWLQRSIDDDPLKMFTKTKRRETPAEAPAPKRRKAAEDASPQDDETPAEAMDAAPGEE
jgi:hypothetical protein